MRSPPSPYQPGRRRTKGRDTSKRLVLRVGARVAPMGVLGSRVGADAVPFGLDMTPCTQSFLETLAMRNPTAEPTTVARHCHLLGSRALVNFREDVATELREEAKRDATPQTWSSAVNTTKKTPVLFPRWRWLSLYSMLAEAGQPYQTLAK